MNNLWKCITTVKDTSVFETLASMYSVPKFPSDLQSFIIMHNAGSPKLDLIKINGIERVFDKMYSFNKEADEEDGESIFSMLIPEIKNALPFGSDPFGNAFLYCFTTGEILFYSHETDTIEATHYTLSEFLENLYER